MSHHSTKDTNEILKQMAEENDLGSTNNFPEGKLTENDEGEIKLAVGITNGKIIMNFGEPVSWIGFNADQAIDIAIALLSQAAKIKR